MRNTIKFHITGTLPQIQDILSKISSYVSDCYKFKTVVSNPVQSLIHSLLQVEIVAPRDVIAEVMDIVDCSEMETSESTISKTQF